MTEINNLPVGVPNASTSAAATPQDNRRFNLTAEELEIIGYFVRGQKRSISSKNLKLESTETSIRLSDCNSKLLGISKQVNQWQRKVLISNTSIYRAIVVENLTDIGFITRQKSSHPEFTEYHYFQLPDGYTLNYTEAIELWKVWWNHKRYQLNNPSPPIDVMTFTKGNWYLVEDLQPSQGNFILKTVKGEIRIEPEEYVVWIDSRSTMLENPDSKLIVPSRASQGRKIAPDLSAQLKPNSADRNTSIGVPTSSLRFSSGGTLLPIEQPQVPIKELSRENIDRNISVGRTELLPAEDLDLESYLNTFNTEDTEDVDRIEGIYHIGELLGDSSSIDPPLPTPTILPNQPVEPQASPAQSTAPKNQAGLSPLQRQESLKLKAMKVLIVYLEEGDRTVRTEVLKNAQGQEINRKIVKIQRGCPSWTIEQIKQLK